MTYMKPPLSNNEKQVYAHLLLLAGGMGCPAELAKLNLSGQQLEAMQELKRKGYLSLTKKRFMMLLPID